VGFRTRPHAARRGAPAPAPTARSLANFWATKHAKRAFWRRKSQDAILVTSPISWAQSGDVSQLYLWFFICIFMIFKKYMSHLKICKYMPPLPYDMALGPIAIWYGGWRCYSVPTAVSHGVCK
jgi:hypothetical protein